MKFKPGRRAPMAEQARLDVLGSQRLAQQRIVEQIDLADREIVRGAPIAIDEAEVAARRRRLSLICHVLADLHPAIVTNIVLARLIPGRHQTKSLRRTCCARSKALARSLGSSCAWVCFSSFCFLFLICSVCLLSWLHESSIFSCPQSTRRSRRPPSRRVRLLISPSTFPSWGSPSTARAGGGGARNQRQRPFRGRGARRIR